MKQIPVSQGYTALVDDADYERVMAAGKWSVAIRRGVYTNRIYAIRKCAPRKRIYLHHFIMGTNARHDHKDGNGLNNQRSNLRPATQSQNCANKSKDRPGCTSQYRGVWWDKRRKRWCCQVKKNGVRYWMGEYREEYDAAQAYNFGAEEHHGEFARFNVVQLPKKYATSEKEKS